MPIRSTEGLEPAVAAPNTWRQLLVFASLLAVALAVAYQNSLGIGFYFDDQFLITDNPAIRHLGNIPRFFSDPFTLTTVRDNADLRPILQITYALNYAISGLNPWSYHLLSLLLHFINALLVFVIVRDYLWRPRDGDPAHQTHDSRARLFPAAAAASIFALVPLNSQVIDYASARSALLTTTFYLLAFLAFLQRRWIGMAVCHALALLTKLIAISLPAVTFAYLVLYRDREVHPRLRDRVRDWRGLVLPVGVPLALDLACLAYRHATMPSWAQLTRHEAGVTPWVWFVSQWPAYLYYIRLFLWPNALSIDHDFPYARVGEPRAWGAFLVLAVWIILAARNARRSPLFAFATAWFFITLMPESLFPLAEVINDHRPYIASSLGLSVLLALGLFSATQWLGSRARVAFVILAAALCVAAIPVIRHRNWIWQDAVRLWRDTAETGPRNGRAWMNLGQALMARGQLTEARQSLERAQRQAPSYALVDMNLSVLDAAEGDRQGSLAHALAAVRKAPQLSLSHYYAGLAWERLGNLDEAARAYARAVGIDGRDALSRQAAERLSGSRRADSLMTIGVDALWKQRDPTAAAAVFRHVLAMNPTHYGATYQLAVALDAMGRQAESEMLWRRVLRMAEGYRDSATAERARGRLRGSR